MYIFADLLEDLFLRLPLKSLGRFKAVSKEWKSILESKTFVEKHLSLRKSGTILTAYDCPCPALPRLLPESRHESGVEFVSLHCDATKPSLSYDGLVCIPETNCVNVLNPSTGQHWRFQSPQLLNSRPNRRFTEGTWSTYFPGYCAMGFGRDSVKGHYKVVRMFVDPNYSDILDVNTGEWKKIYKPRRYKVDVGRKSACVNGKIYWLRMMHYDVGVYMIVALDLHTEEFHDVQRLPLPEDITYEAQIVNIGDRLAIAMPQSSIIHGWELEIWNMSAQEETWSKTHSISLACLDIKRPRSFTPVTLSKEGNVVFFDNKKRLFKYYQERDELNLLSRDIRVISPHVENLVPIHTNQVELRTRITCPRRTKDWNQSRVGNVLLSKGIDLATWLWKKKNKMLAIYLLAFLLCSCFRAGIEHTIYCVANLILLYRLTGSGFSMPLPISHVITTMVMVKIYSIIINFLDAMRYR